MDPDQSDQLQTLVTAVRGAADFLQRAADQRDRTVALTAVSYLSDLVVVAKSHFHEFRDPTFRDALELQPDGSYAVDLSRLNS